jgi:hypothetical protein
MTMGPVACNLNVTYMRYDKSESGEAKNLQTRK